MNHVVLIGHGKMGTALAKGWVKKNTKFKGDGKNYSPPGPPP